MTGFRTTGDHRFKPGITGGIIGFGGLGGRRFEGRSIREDAIRDCVRRGFPALADLPFTDSWCGPIDRTRSGLPLFGALPGLVRTSSMAMASPEMALRRRRSPARILASLALGTKDEWSTCGLVRPPGTWLPPEPIRYIGAHMVRAAIKRKDRLDHEGRRRA